MVAPDDLGNLSVVIYVPENLFTDRGMPLHLAALVQRERPRLLEEACRQTDLPYVVNQPTQMCEGLLMFASTHPLRDVASVDRNGC